MALDAAGVRFEWRDAGVPGELGVGLEAVDRPDLGEHLRRRDSGAAGQLEQCRRQLRRSLFELLLKLCDRPVERPDALDELASEAHLQLLLAPGQPAADPLELRSPIEPPQRHLVGRVELMQMPAQPLLGAAALIDQIVAVIDQ